MNTVFIVGFMGAGKSTIGKKIATKMGYSYTDLDSTIAGIEQKSITQIITEKGEPYFRKIEADTLRQTTLSRQIIATGGGTACFFDNMNWMKAMGIVVYIELDEGVLLNRIQSTNLNTRPLIRGMNMDELKNFIHSKLQERTPYYASAHLIYSPLTEHLDTLIAKINAWEFKNI